MFICNLWNSNDKLLLNHPVSKPRATLGDRSYTCNASKLWNVLPLDVRSAKTVDVFKTKLKSHHFFDIALYFIGFFFLYNIYAKVKHFFSGTRPV